MLLGTPPERKSLLKYLTGKEKKRGQETMQRGGGVEKGEGTFCSVQVLQGQEEKGCAANERKAHTVFPEHLSEE